MYREKKRMDEAFTLMPKNFTSKDFTEECKILGVPKSITRSGACGDYLKNRKDVVHVTKFRWEKCTKRNNSYSQESIRSLKIIERPTPKTDEIQEAIDLLKLNGYEIYKKIQM